MDGPIGHRGDSLEVKMARAEERIRYIGHRVQFLERVVWSVVGVVFLGVGTAVIRLAIPTATTKMAAASFTMLSIIAAMTARRMESTVEDPARQYRVPRWQHAMLVVMLVVPTVACFLYLWWIFYPYHVLNIRQVTVMTREVSPGGYLIYSVDYCKDPRYNEVRGQTLRQLTGVSPKGEDVGPMYALPSGLALQPLLGGCHVTPEALEVPHIPPGKYVLEASREYPVNPVRSVPYRMRSEPFEVKAEETPSTAIMTPTTTINTMVPELVTPRLRKLLEMNRELLLRNDSLIMRNNELIQSASELMKQNAKLIEAREK